MTDHDDDLDRYFLVYYSKNASHTAGPYESEEDARAAVDDEKQSGDRSCVIVGPLPIDDLPAVALINFEEDDHSNPPA